MTRLRCLPALVSFLSLTCAFVCTADAQWRGHYVHRVGKHGHEVERYHWGGGLTPTGGAVLMRGIDAFAPIVGGLIGSGGKSVEETVETKAATKSTLATCEAYARAQEEANVLLVRTAALVNNLPPVGGGGQSASIGTVRDQRLRGEQPTTQERQLFGENPWGVDPLP